MAKLHEARKKLSVKKKHRRGMIAYAFSTVDCSHYIGTVVWSGKKKKTLSCRLNIEKEKKHMLMSLRSFFAWKYSAEFTENYVLLFFHHAK